MEPHNHQQAATTTLMRRIKALDPESATKTMGYILIQGPSENDIFRLSQGPDALLISYINQGKALGNLISNNALLLNNNNNNFNFHAPTPRAAVDNFPAMFPGEGRRVFRDQKTCMYFNKGNCKNGWNCKFTHGVWDDGGFEGFGNEELVRIKEAVGFEEEEERRFLGGGGGEKNDVLNFIEDDDVGDDNHRYDFLPMGLSDGEDPSSRQIYLTFASDSTFKEDDVSAYFSTFGPVQDVRIPYQQKRMFGFVTFLYAETVKHILELKNPHHVCGSRVLVKRYKDKKQLMERGEYPGVDTRELLNNPIGPRLLLKKQRMMHRRKMEQELILQHNLELERLKMVDLHLMNMRNGHHMSPMVPFQPPHVPIPSPRQAQFMMMQNVSSDVTNQEALQDVQASNYPTVTAENRRWMLEGSDLSTNNHIGSGNNLWHFNDDEFNLPESLEHTLLPDDLFASPKKASAQRQSVFASVPPEADDSITTDTSSNNTSTPPGNSAPTHLYQMTRQGPMQMGKRGSD